MFMGESMGLREEKNKIRYTIQVHKLNFES